MEETVIPRSETQIDVGTFERMFQLCHDYPWLWEKSKAFGELWNMTDNEPQKALIELMLERFKYISADQGEGYMCVEIAKQITDGWGLLPENTIITATCGDPKPDGSQRVVQSVKNKFRGWPENRFYNNIVDAAHHLTPGLHVVVVDDFIGTGKTVGRKIKYLQDRAAEGHFDIEIKVVALAMMKFAADRLKELDVEYFAYVELEKGIDDIPDAEKREEARQAMEQLEAKLHPTKPKKLELHRFGYRDSQALFAFGTQNIPNNVFPVFWWDFDHNGKLRETIFRRIYDE